MLFLARYWYFIAIGVLLAALAASGAYVTVIKAQKAALVAEKEQLVLALDVSTGSIKRLETAINDQNAAIDKLQLDAAERERANQAEVTRVKALAETYRKQASDLMGKKIPQGVNVCDAANMLFNEEIKRNGK